MPRISTDNYDTVAAWNGSQDLFIVEQPDGTKVATPAMVKQYVLGNSIDDIYSVMGQNGAKNLIPYPYNETTQVDHGVTFTVNNDGTVIANGTANGTSQLYLVLGNVSLSAAENLVINTDKPLFLSGCPSGGGNTTYRIQYGLTDGTTYWAKTASDTGSGVKITPVTGLNSYCFDVIKIMVFDGCTVNNLTFKPMLRLASDTDNTYQPYAKTNRQLTEVIGDLSQTDLTGDSVAAQLATARGDISSINTALAGKQNTLTFDNAPTASSNNPVKSGGVKTYVDNAIAQLNNDLASKLNWKVAGAFNADGSITLNYSLDSASEIMITLFLDLPRQTVLIDSISRFRQYNLFPDFLTYEGRVYARISYVDATHVTISQLTGLSALGSSAQLIIEIR